MKSIKWFILFLCSSVVFVVYSQPVHNVVVAKDGSGDFTSIQSAIDAAPTNRTTPYILFIKNGTYQEKVTIPSNKTFIQLYGESVANTIISFNDYSGKPMPGGGTFGTSNSATVIINAADFSAKNITFENTTGDSPQALAINVNADRAAFKNCRFLGGQDTMLNNGGSASGRRNYFKDCYIDGVVDFIFGGAIVVLENCVIHAKSRQDGNSSYITAANTSPNQNYGYVLRDCVFPSNTGVTKYVLGRPWQNSTSSDPRSFPRVVLLNATLGNNLVKPEGWSVWDAGTITSSIYYAEYKSKKFNGALVDVSQRVPWSFQLSDVEASQFTNATLFGNWDPCAVFDDDCVSSTKQIAVSNFKVKKNTSISLISWNISWAMTGISYKLYRSTNNTDFEIVDDQVSVNDSTINFSFTDSNPPAGETFYYYMEASKSGLSAHRTTTVTISSTPTISITGALSNFLQGGGIPSPSQGYQVSGVNLINPVMITPPTGFEVSNNGGVDWHKSVNPLILNSSGGTLAPVSILVRLNATTNGSFNGVITHVSNGAQSIEMPVSGQAQSDPLPVSKPLLYWPMNANNSDKVEERAEGVPSSTPTFKKLVVSDGTTLPSFSGGHGQVFAPSANGLWTTASGGPGGNLNRTVYQQYTISASNGFAVRVDSILLKGSYYNTSSNTKLAIVYSRTNFTTNDSTDVSGGVGADGNVLPISANGGFTTPVLLVNETSGTSNQYKFALNGTEGTSIQSGQTLTLRLYFSCGSTSTGRYAKLKDVLLKGDSYANSLSPQIQLSGNLQPFTQTGSSPSSTQTYSVSGSNLSTGIVITPPTGFEVSVDGTSWKRHPQSLFITPVVGAVNATVSVRLNATSDGEHSGEIDHSSTGVSPIGISASGSRSELVTGIHEHLQFSIYPNPAENFLMVEHPYSLSGEVTIYSMVGQVALHSLSNSPKEQIDISHMASGFYLAEFVNGNERVRIKFLKK